MAVAVSEVERPVAARRIVVWIIVWAALALATARVGLAEVAVRGRSPAQALALAPHNAEVLAGVATTLQLAGRQRQAVGLADAALAREPMNVAALRTLGLAREKLGDSLGATRAMFLAAPLGWRDVAVQLWLVRAYAQRGFIAAALERTDALARLDKVPEVTFPIFIASLRDDRARLALAHQMADRPFWRALFFYRLLELPADQIQRVDRLIAALAAAGSPITPEERDVYLTRLVQVGRGPAALAYWLHDQRASAPVAVAPWDGGFEKVASRGTLGAPFQWHLSAQSARVANIQPGTHGSQLVITPGQDLNGALISQTILLVPGRYRLTARTAGEAMTGLRWAIRCLPAQDEVPVQAGSDTETLNAVTFSIPDDGHCATQQLEIDAVPGEDSGTGRVTVDDVSIRRVG